MTITEVFFLFLRNGNLTPNERLALTREIRNKIYSNYPPLCRNDFNLGDSNRYINEATFAERLISNSWYMYNTLGRFGSASCCSSLSSFMRYLLYYLPSIIGTAKKKNKYLERENIEIEIKIGYKKYWETRLIKKWHDFLKEYIARYDRLFIDNHQTFNLKEGIIL